MNASVPQGGGRIHISLPPHITREDLGNLLAEAGLRVQEGADPRPTAAILAEFIHKLDNSVDPYQQNTADKLLRELASKDRDFTIDLRERRNREELSAEDLQSREGYYRRLAEILADFIVDWLNANPFGERSLLTAIIVAEHLLALHGFRSELAWGEPLRGAVCRYAWRLSHPEENTPATRDQLVNAILGRFRKQAT